MDRKDFERMAPDVRRRVVDRARIILHDGDEAQDVAQETLLKLWSLRGRLDTLRSFEAMAMVIARNRCIDLLRQAGNNRRIPLEDFDIAANEATPLSAIISSEEVRRIENIVSSLPEGQRIVLEMKHRDHLEVEEIARLTDSNPNAIRVTLSRARHRVRDIFFNR